MLSVVLFIGLLGYSKKQFELFYRVIGQNKSRNHCFTHLQLLVMYTLSCSTYDKAVRLHYVCSSGNISEHGNRKK